MFHGFDYRLFHTGTPKERLGILREATNWILRPEFQEDNGIRRYIQAVTELSKAFALCSTEDEAIALREDIGFFQAIKAILSKHIESAQVIQELINLAQEVREAAKRGETLGLTENELAFYDALEVNDSAVQILGDDVLKAIARDLVEAVRKNVTIDWTERETVRAKMRAIIKRLLRKHGYPPDKQAQATETVITQAETLCKDWATESNPNSGSGVIFCCRMMQEGW
jgi:type I site-specific restriction-modification system R (restriction) subunit